MTSNVAQQSSSATGASSTNNGMSGNDTASLSQTMQNLSIRTSSPPKSPRRVSKPPSPFKPSVNRSPSAASSRGPLSRTPSASGASFTTALTRRESSSGSRSSSPALLRKVSTQSLQSVSGVAPPRRASSVHMGSTPPPPSSRLAMRGVSPDPPPEAPPRTEASVAREYFDAEITAHHGFNAGGETDAETVVILHDAVYGHRYSRPRTSRASLSTIVERPERIKASVLGVSAAYVRLGERHAGASYPPHPHLDPGSIGSVPFRIRKTERKMALNAQAVTNVHGTKWMEELKLMCDSAEAKLAQNGKELARPEMQREAGETPAKLHEGDLYLCAESLEALESALGGVCEAIDTVFDPLTPTKRAFVAIRPPGHHCSASYPSGFCWLNNVHVGAMHGMLAHGMTHAAILDFDLHHGDGSQAIAWQHNSRSVAAGKNAAWWKRSHIGYFSLHDINSYPCEMGDEDKVRNASLCIDGAHGQSVWNVHLEGWKSNAEFWELYENKYGVLLEKMRGFLRAHTERLRAAGQVSRAAIFLSAGFDASEWEGAGMQRHNVNVPTDFYARVTRDVVRIAQEEGTSVDGRVISVLEGGYSDRALMSGIFSHLCGLAGDEAGPTKEADYNGLGYEMGQRMGTVDQRAESTTTKRAFNGPAYDPAWWSVNELERLEAATAAPPPAPPKKPRSSMPPTYSSPTQASTAKVNATAPKVRRSMSGLSSLSLSQSNGASSPLRTRPPSPPPPEVPWTTAVHELSKLLIPSGRQTGSCTAEDLSAEATRARRDRQSALATQMQGLQVDDVAEAAQVQTPVSRMGLRERKAVKSIVPIHEEEDGKWGKNRRKTLGTERAGSRSGTPLPAEKQPLRQSRRLSAASAVVPELLDPLPTSSRSDTPSTVRPESSMSTAIEVTTATTATDATVGTLPVKKTRVSMAPKKDGAPRAPRVPKKAAAPKPAAGGSRPGGKAGSASDQGADGLDQITSGMRRIKLVTKAEREARERATKAPGAVNGAAIKRENSDGIPGGDEDAITVASSMASGPATPMTEESPLPPLPVFNTPAESRFAPMPISSPMPVSRRPGLRSSSASPIREAQQANGAISTPVRGSAAANGLNGDVSDTLFVPYEPEGPAPVNVLGSKQTLQWLPPNVMETPAQPSKGVSNVGSASSASSVTSVKRSGGANAVKEEGGIRPATPVSSPTPMKRTDVPVFTATGAIPFARMGDGSKKEEEGDEKSVWDNLEPPAKK